MRDPQMWANKMLSNALHITNTTAKGGIIAEKNAFDNEKQAESSYPQPNEIAWAAAGAVSNQKIMPKPGTGEPERLPEAAGVRHRVHPRRDRRQHGVARSAGRQSAQRAFRLMVRLGAEGRKD